MGGLPQSQIGRGLEQNKYFQGWGTSAQIERSKGGRGTRLGAQRGGDLKDSATAPLLVHLAHGLAPQRVRRVEHKVPCKVAGRVHEGTTRKERRTPDEQAVQVATHAVCFSVKHGVFTWRRAARLLATDVGGSSA